MTEQSAWPGDNRTGGYTGPPPTSGPDTGQSYPGQPYAGQPYPGQPYAGQPYPGQPYPGQPYGGYPVAYPLVYPAAPGYVLTPITDPRDQRPGGLTASAVLGYINAGLLIFAALLLFDGASIAHDLQNQGQHVDTELGFDGVLNLLAAGLLIGGAVGMTTRSAVGRIVYCAGAVIVVGETIYWIARWNSLATFGINFWALVFGGLSIVGTSLSWVPGSTAWFERGRHQRADALTAR